MGEPRKASTSLQQYLLRYVQHFLHPTEQTVVSNGNVHAAARYLAANLTTRQFRSREAAENLPTLGGLLHLARR